MLGSPGWSVNSVFQARAFFQPESQKITSDLCKFEIALKAQLFRNNEDIYSQDSASGARCPVTKLPIQNYRVRHRFTIQIPEALR